MRGDHFFGRGGLSVRSGWLMPAAIVVAAAAGQARAGYELELVVGGLNKPIFATHAPGDSDGLYIVPQRDSGHGAGIGTGTIVRHDLATGATTDFLQVTGLDTDTQGGLHSLAFHPDYQPDVEGSKFYLIALEPSPTPQIANNTLQEWVLGPAGAPQFSRTLMQFPGLETNDATHAMDWIGFRPGAVGDERDWLYMSVGDGGVQSNDSHYVNNPQDLSSMRGKMLRLDVGGADDRPGDPDRNYGFTPTIYFGDDEANDGVPGETAPEVYYSGLRNPWRASFDRETGDLWIGDVGHGGAEELNFVAGGVMGLDDGGQSAGPGAGVEYGIDFGWPRREGDEPGRWGLANDGGPLDPDGEGPRPESIDPVYAFTRSGDPESIRSITGGYVYRGPDQHPALQGQYFLGGFDFPEAKVMAADFTPNATGLGGDISFDIITPELQASIAGQGLELVQLSSFAEDAAGNVYLIDFGDECSSTSGCSAETGWTGVLTEFGTGEVYRLVYVPDPSEGDYNNDGMVNAADFTVWRDHLGEEFTLLNESVTPGVVTEEDYQVWVANFGSISPLFSEASNATVPVPAAAFLLALAVGAFSVQRRKLIADC
ncbi:hypothetical protein Mal64_01570 [Pseudobythopirellula maris]|uniref:Glucose/Sorbosone dehydrogenase domain-containing protein n=1 Tax=Pseudobythopirellula maris TaxID=2527991 RepID=A0A5C5ZRV4_9BACT|nr:PQQ-dependent sugar dehydrogenase [Pseudobythopirellula maris]TWT89778.1 hypothetical protein Mal64_01570 [Pseudobythopirellula maris]